mgnify:FL=1
MRLLYPLLLLICLSNGLQAQCDFDATIEGDLILCPNANGQLFTQEYEAYQWMKRAYNETEATPINGATEQFLDVSSANDVGYYMSVEVTLDNCTEMSEEILVDSWWFLPVTVASVGDFEIGNMGEAIICSGDSMFFEMNLPYDTNIIWYKDGVEIVGETDSKLVVYEAGAYTVQGAPSICPDYTQFLGLDLIVEVVNCTNTTEQQVESTKLSCFPNPVQKELNIKSTYSIQRIQLLDLTGKILLDQTQPHTSCSLNIEGAPAGLYLIQAHTSAGILTQKVFVQ